MKILNIDEHGDNLALLEVADTAQRRSPGTETLLVVEDEEMVREVARRALCGAGYTVLTAASGDEALQIFAEHEGEIRLLLTDVVMPRMNGKALAEELLKTHPELEVLYMSGYADDVIVHHGVLDAGTNFIGKPFMGDDLVRKVREVLGGVDGIADGPSPDGRDQT
jgi:two-component system, cell cycle sensor histidine kinase and response regulator CckA